MFIPEASPVAPSTIRPCLRHFFLRAAFVGVGTITTLASTALDSAAQSAPVRKWEFRVSSGAFIPAGEQRNYLKSANLTAAQLSWIARPSLAVTSTVGWARSRDIASINSPKLDVFTSDLGVEARGTQLMGGRMVTVTPFVGIGGGARFYNYRSLHVDATNNLAGYIGAGGDVAVGRVGVRLEARDYATGFKPLAISGTSATRNDVVIMAALRFKRHEAQQ
jgi:hypothetical protein